MTLQQCRNVLQIVKCGSFSEAALTLFISQASLSESIKNLEKELGIQIFNRSNKGISLTNEGGEFVEYAARLTAEANFIRERYTAGKSMRRLYVITQHYDFVAEAFSRFLNTISDSPLSVSLQESKTMAVLEGVREGRYDLGVLAVRNEDRRMWRHLEKSRLLFSAVGEAMPHVFLRTSHPLAKKERLSFKDLAPYTYISYAQSAIGGLQLTEELSDYTTPKHVEINDRATLMNLLLSTDSVTIGTGLMPSSLNDGRIAAVPLESEEKYTVGLIERENTVRTEEATAFSEMLTEFFIHYCQYQK